jgi:hypothetical protein
MEVLPAGTLDRDQVPAAIIIEGDMQRLMNVADPMPEAFEEPKLVAQVQTERQVARVVQRQRGKDARRRSTSPSAAG